MRLRRPSTPVLISIAIHLVVGAFFVQALVLRRPWFDIFGRQPTEPMGPVERIGFLTLPKPGAGGNQPGRRGGDGRPESKTPPAPPVVAPTTVPTKAPSAPSASKKVDEEPGTGPLIGGGGKLRGIQPRYEDPRLWGPPGTVATAPKSSAERLDSVANEALTAYKDSVRMANANRRDPTDWTIEKGGQKYGVDSKFIRLGPVSIPTAVLALLPLNVGSNPTVNQRERANNYMHNDIATHAQQSINEADFQKAVKNIRIRKERERQEREKQKAAEQTNAPAANANSGSTTP